MRAEYREANTMKFNMRFRVSIASTWFILCGIALSLPAQSAAHSDSCATVAAYYETNLTADTPAPVRRGSNDCELILDDRGNRAASTPAWNAVEPPHAIANFNHPTLQGFAISVSIKKFDPKRLVEPRFLRYGRLLN